MSSLGKLLLLPSCQHFSSLLRNAPHRMTPEGDKKRSETERGRERNSSSPLTVCLVLQVARVRLAQRRTGGRAQGGTHATRGGVATPSLHPIPSIPTALKSRGVLRGRLRGTSEEREAAPYTVHCPPTPRDRHERDALPRDLVILNDVCDLIYVNIYHIIYIYTYTLKKNF